MEVRGFPGPNGPIDVSLQPGDRIWVRGPNGSGKTSLLRCLAGLPAPMGTPGQGGAGLCFQDGRDNLIGLTVDGELQLRGLPQVGDRREATERSTGETKQFALQLSKKPVWLLDEPLDGLDQAARAKLRQEVVQHKGPIVFVDHTEAWADLATDTLSLGPTPALERSIVNRAAEWKVGQFELESAFVNLRGPMGCGKSTLLREFALGNDCAYLPPSARDLLLTPQASKWLPEPPNRHPLQWSGGELQRLALSHVFAKDAPILVLDEPDRHLDAQGLLLLRDAMQEAIDAGRHVIIASHLDWGHDQWW